TEGELRARADADERARAQQARRDAAPSPDEFTLAGSDRPADQAAARGQQDLAPAGRFDSIVVPAETIRWMGFDGKRSVRADLAALAQRHPEYYDSPASVRQDIEFVLEEPDGWYIHKGARVVLFRERIGTGAIPQSRVEVDADAQDMTVRSVYVGNKRQIAKKMADKREVLDGLGLAGQ